MTPSRTTPSPSGPGQSQPLPSALLLLLQLILPLTALCILLSAWVTLQPASPPPALAVSGTAAPCTQPITFTPGFESSPGSVVMGASGTVQLAGVGWAETSVCGPGTLILDAEGKVAGGEAPRLTVTLGGRWLGNFAVTDRQTLRVNVPAAGRLRLAYLNDYYRSEARVATLTRFYMEGRGCQELMVEAPPTSGATYDPALRQLDLVNEVPVLVTPCRAGVLSLQLRGPVAAGASAQVSLTDGNSPAQVVQTVPNWQTVRLKVSGRPLRLAVTNPHFKELANRDLLLHHVRFDAAQP